MECFLVKNARVGCQRSREEGIRTACLSPSLEVQRKRAKKQPGLSAVHILRPGLNAGRRGATLRSPLRIWGNWRELGAESGGWRTDQVSSILGMERARVG